MVLETEPLRLLHELVGAELAVGGGDIRDWLPAHPGEVPLEQRERIFLAARRAATDAALNDILVRSGFEPVAVPKATEGFRLWPYGLLGSISHRRTINIAVVALSPDYHGIGVDLEYDDGADLSEIPGLVDPEDLNPWSMQDSITRLLSFSAKEAVYKAIYPSTRIPLAYEDILLRWAGDLRAPTAVAHVGTTRLAVRAVVQHPWIVTLALWP